MKEQQKRIIDLQHRLKIANDALGRIQSGCRNPENVASDALYDQMAFEPKAPLQGVVGHAQKHSSRPR